MDSQNKYNIIFSARNENNIEYRGVCKKLDFSDISENTFSNYSISDNENMDINENSSEDLTEIKNLENSSFSSSSSIKTKNKIILLKKSQIQIKIN